MSWKRSESSSASRVESGLPGGLTPHSQLVSRSWREGVWAFSSFIGEGVKRRAKEIIKRAILHLAKNHPRLIDQLVNELIKHRYHMPFPLTHYYSPLPDIPAVKKRLNRWYKRGMFDAVQWDLEKQLHFLNQLQVYKTESEGLPSCDQITAEGYGQGYGEIEARLLHCMVRYLKPRRVIEVGAGVSTYYTLNALRVNDGEGHIPGEMACIDPYPSVKISELANQGRIKLYAKEVQDVEINTFRDLEENDLLFIDSSHVAKIDSDVNWLYLEVFPNLNKGVVIHIHDICFPYLTVMPEHPLFEQSLLWNETALVKAFMMYNEVFEVLMCQSYLHHERPEVIKNIVNSYDNQTHFPASLWLMKQR